VKPGLRPPKRFCPIGHDTEVVGRSNGACNQCRRDASRNRERRVQKAKVEARPEKGDKEKRCAYCKRRPRRQKFLFCHECQQKPRRLRKVGGFSSALHRFNDKMECHWCGVAFELHQHMPHPCPSARG